MITLKFKEETSPSGRVSNVANASAILKRLSDDVPGKGLFAYVNGAGETINYRLATVQFTDDLGVKHFKDSVVVYEKSYTKGMEIGACYLMKITLATEKNDDGTSRRPWVTLSSALVGEAFSADEFATFEPIADLQG